MGDDVACNRSGTITDTITRTDEIIRVLSHVRQQALDIGRRVCVGGNVKACAGVCVLFSNVGGDGCVRDGCAMVLIGANFSKSQTITTNLSLPQRLVRDA